MENIEFYKKIQYPDGDFYIELLEVKKEFIFRINNFEDLWELNHTIDVLNYNGVVPCVTIPNLISCQADKRFKENQSFGYNLVHRFLGSLNATFKVFHPHQEMCTLLDSVEIIDNSEFVEKVLDRLRPINNLILMSTDGGSYKWINKIADKIGFRNEVYGASKMRKYEDNKSKLTQVIDRQDFQGKDILIVDDICVFGGTFKGLSKMLRERNCGKLYLAISHMTVQNLGEDPVTNYFDKVFTTNSKFDKYIEDDKINKYGQPQNLEIIKLF